MMYTLIKNCRREKHGTDTDHRSSSGMFSDHCKRPRLHLRLYRLPIILIVNQGSFMLVLLQLINIMGLQCMESEIKDIMRSGVINPEYLKKFFEFIQNDYGIELNESQRLLFKRVLITGKYKSGIAMFAA